MTEENVLPIGSALLPGNVRRCSYCEREIVRVATGVAHIPAVWVERTEGAERVEIFSSSAHSLHVENCPVLSPRVVTCGYCPKRIVWLRTAKGGKMPVVAASWDGRAIYDRAVHYTHFADCPKSRELSRHGKRGDA